MEMASSAANGTGGGSGASRTNTRVLPSLFGDHGIGSGSVNGAASKDLDNLIAMNDSALSQQIEFILQDAPMEQDDDDDDEDDDDDMLPEEVVAAAATAIKLENPPTTIVTSASKYNHTQEAIVATSPCNPQEHLLNGRRIIIQSTENAGIADDDDDDDDDDEEEDPELNDENLQDIEEEAQAAEAEEEEQLQLQSQIKIEHQDPDDDDTDDQMDFINTPTMTHHTPIATQTPQLVLPAGSIVSTTPRALTVPVSEALTQLQRRPVYISNAAMGSMAGAAFVRMPAVISRSPMAVLNVVQQGVAGAGAAQLILQAGPVPTTATPVVVTSSAASLSATSANALSLAEVTMAKPSIVTVTASPTTPSIPTTSSVGILATVPVTSGSGSGSGSNASTASPSTLSSNTTSTASTTTYQCVECVEKFESKELFDIHRSGHANNMKCAICNMVLKSLKNYEKHCLRCKPYECQICGRVVRFRPNFIKHMRVHTGQQSERHKYKCDVCHKEFMSFEYFKVHKKIHNENVNLTCEICGKVFSALASLRGHSKLHSGVKLHKCDVCGKGFGQRYNLKIHARTHTGDFPFECKICKKKLHTQSSLQTHMQVHQRDQTSQVTTTIKFDQSTTTSSAATTTTGNSNINPTATIVKLKPQNSVDGPSTSGLQHQQLQSDDMDDHSGVTEGLQGTHIVTTTTTRRNVHVTTADDSSNESSNTSHELQHHQQAQQQQAQQQLQQQSQQMMVSTPTRTVVIKNYIQSDQNLASPAVLGQQQTQVIQGVVGNSNALQQQLLRKTPIIHSTGGASTLNSTLTSVVQQTGISPSPSPSSSSTSCSSSVVVSKTGAPLSLASVAVGTSTIRSTRNHHINSQSITTSNHHRALHRNNHRNHHRRRQLADIDDDDDDDDDDDSNLNSANGHSHFDDDDDDEKSSPSLATAAIIKKEPNLYSSGSGDNSNEMLIKEEVMFEDSAAPHSPHSPPISKFRISNFDNDLVDHHVDLNHSLPPYGNLFETHSIPDSIPVQLYPDDDEDFRLDHSALSDLHNSTPSTTDGDFIKKEWVYGAGTSYAINGKFDDDSDALCDAANFIYN